MAERKKLNERQIAGIKKVIRDASPGVLKAIGSKELTKAEYEALLDELDKLYLEFAEEYVNMLESES